MPPSFALLGRFAIGARVSLLRQHTRARNVSECLYSLYAWLCVNLTWQHCVTLVLSNHVPVHSELNHCMRTGFTWLGIYTHCSQAPVHTTREHGPCWRPVLTGVHMHLLTTRVDGPCLRPVNTSSVYRALHKKKQMKKDYVRIDKRSAARKLIHCTSLQASQRGLNSI